MKLPGGLPGATPAPNPAAAGAPAGRKKPGMKLSDIGGAQPTNGSANGGGPAPEKPREMSQMEKYAQFVDTKNGALTFKGKATVNAQGI
ncbi:MAP kinase kinase Wis1, partial [Teratosphaeriaceae sp. CCFEE 6253]